MRKKGQLRFLFFRLDCNLEEGRVTFGESDISKRTLFAAQSPVSKHLAMNVAAGVLWWVLFSINWSLFCLQTLQESTWLQYTSKQTLGLWNGKKQKKKINLIWKVIATNTMKKWF